MQIEERMKIRAVRIHIARFGQRVCCLRLTAQKLFACGTPFEKRLAASLRSFWTKSAQSGFFKRSSSPFRKFPRGTILIPGYCGTRGGK